MNITVLRSDAVYRKMLSAPEAQRVDIFRDELLAPFAFKWQCVGAPLRADQPGGYEAMSVVAMGGGYLPAQITAARQAEIEAISSDAFWSSCEKSIRDTLAGFERHGVRLPTQDYLFTVLLNDPHNPMSAMTGDYCGDGGIPGYILGTIVPSERALRMLPMALAHEANHNVRWQFMPWSSSITLADMLVSEGLAEVFAASMFGEDNVGRWVKSTDADTLRLIIKPAIRAALRESDFNLLSAYLYGDEIMAARGGTAVGMPYCAGYACGYALIQHYLKKTGRSIYEATLIATEEILKDAEDFWV